MTPAPAATVAAALGADVLWYALGRVYGTRVLASLLRFSLDPDSLTRRRRNGIPGASWISPAALGESPAPFAKDREVVF